MQQKKIITTIIFFTIFFSCKKVIDVDINNSSPQIVIEGLVTNQPERFYSVYLLNTINLNSDSDYYSSLIKSKAHVTIKNNAGLKDTTLYFNDDYYTTNRPWVGQSGVTYTLTVNLSGKVYAATSTMPQQVKLDSVGFVKVDAIDDGDKIIEAVPYFQDPPGVVNYYAFQESTKRFASTRLFLFSDYLSDGKYISLPIYDIDTSRATFTAAPLLIGDSLILSMYCIDENAYNYYFTLQQITGNNLINSPTPANPVGNISGGALGLFSAQTIQTDTVVVR